MNYPGVRYLIGRKELSNLKRTTLASLFKILKEFGATSSTMFKMNSQTNNIKFSNGSEIVLMDMAHSPSDPEYTRFGGLELTGAFIDESNECEEKAIIILSVRIGRWMNEEYQILPKLLETFNPSKNHIYYRFYEPWKNKSLPGHRVFIPAKVTDNPYLDPNYIKQLENADEVTRQRLLHGNFEYDDDARALVNFKKIYDVFTNSFVLEGDKYLSSDLAMQGRDNFVTFAWNGYRGKLALFEAKSDGKKIEDALRELALKNCTPESNIVADSDGMGSYLEGYMKNIYTFHGGGEARNKEFAKLKDECGFKLAEKINKNEIYLEVPDEQMVRIGGRDRRAREVIAEELGQLKRNNIAGDTEKKKLISKDEMKKNIGRSPDFLDCVPGGTLVKTVKGNIQIKDVQIGDEIITPYGVRKVLRTANKLETHLYRLTLNNGAVLYCSTNHKVYLGGKFINLDAFIMSAETELCTLKNLLKWRFQKLLNTTERNTGFQQQIQNTIMQITSNMEKEQKKHFIDSYGKKLMEEDYVQENAFTILTETISTISLLIWKQLIEDNIKVIMQKNYLRIKNFVNKIRNIWKTSETKLSHGIEQNMEKNFMKKIILKELGKESKLSMCVKHVEKNLLIQEKNLLLAQIPAGNGLLTNTKKDLKIEHVLFVAKPSQLERMKKPSAVQEVALIKCAIPERIYDINVQKDHCYYANEILISNCMIMRLVFENQQNFAFLDKASKLFDLS